MNEKKIFEADNAITAVEYMRSIIKKGDVIYIKGSQGMRMERTVKELMAYPDQAHDLLVRQDDKWIKSHT